MTTGISTPFYTQLQKIRQRRLLTAEQAKEYGFTLEPDWTMKGDFEGEEPKFTFISPEKWEFSDLVYDEGGEVLDYTALSPEGKPFTRAELEVLPPEPPIEPLVEGFDEKEVPRLGQEFARLRKEWVDTGDPALKARMDDIERQLEGLTSWGIQPEDDLPALVERIYPEMFRPEASYGFTEEEIPGMVTETIQTWVQEDTEAFIEDLISRGRTEDTEALLRTFVEGSIHTDTGQPYTPQEITELVDEVFGEVLPEMIDEELIYKEYIRTGGKLKVDEWRMAGTPARFQDEREVTPAATGWRAVWNKLRTSVSQSWFQTRDYFVSVLPELMFKDIKYDPESKVGLERDPVAVARINEKNREQRDKFREISVRIRGEQEEWVAKHPELKPPPEWEGEILTLLKNDPTLILDPAFIAYIAADSAFFMAAFWGATAVVGFTTKNPILGMAAGVAVTTPAQSQDLYQDLLRAGAKEEQAAQLAVPVGLLISSVEMLGGIAVLRAVGAMPGMRPFYQLFRRNLQREVAKGILSTMAKRGLISFTEIELAEIFEEILQGAIQNALVKTFDESREVLGGITETVLRTFISVLPLGIIGGGVNVAQTYRQMSAEQRGQVEADQTRLEDAGLPPEQAEMIAFTNFAETEEGQVVIDKVMEQVPEVPEAVRTLPLEEVSKLETRIPIDLIRKDEATEIARLTEEIQREGITEPIVIRVREDGSQIVWDGIHRLIVAQDLGIKNIPVRFIGEEGLAVRKPPTEPKPPVAPEVVEAPPVEEVDVEEIGRMEMELGGLEEYLAAEPATKLINLIKKTGWSKGEISNLTLKQYRDIKGREEIPPSILTPDKKHVKWEYALDDVATEMGYESGEALKYAIEQVGEANIRIKALRSELARAPIPPMEEVEVDVEVRRQLDELSKMADIWSKKLADRETTKASLARFVRENLPPNIRGRYITAVARVKTDAQLQTQMAKVQEFAELNAQKVLRAEIAKEIKRTQAKVKEHILRGKFTPETQRMLDTIRHNLELPRAQAQDKIASNFDRYNKDEISWEEMNKENEALNFVGIKEMTSQELIETLDYIKVLRDIGRSERQAKREAYIEKITRIRQDAIDTASGGKGSAKGVYAIPKSEWQATQSFLDKVINWMYNWDSILDKISKFKRDLPFKSPISIFGARVHRARHLQHSLQQEAQATAIKGLEDIYKTKDRHQLNRILNSWKHEIINLGEFELAAVEGVEEAVVKPIRMTKGQMMVMYNLLKDPTLDSTFRNTMRWTDEIMDAVRNNLTAEEKAYADFAMDFFKNDLSIGYDAINKVYSDIYGVDLNNNPYYFPAFRDMESQIFEDVLTFQEARDYASVLNGSLKVRVSNVRALKFTDITDLIASHITKQAHFIAWGHTMRDMRSVFGNKEVRETIEQYHGEHIMKEITKNLNDMARDGVERQQFGFIADYLRGNFTRAILGVKASLLLKQIPSVFAYMTEMSIGDFVTGVENYWHNPVDNYRFMLQRSPYLRERFGAGFERDVHFANEKKPADFLSGRKPVKSYITENIRFGDKFAVMQGMWAKMLSELKAMGVTMKTATEAQITEALQAAEDVTNRTQPAFDIETLAPLQRGGPWVKLLTMFQTQPGQYFRIIGNNFRNFQYHRGTRFNATKNIVLVWVVLPMLWQLIADGFQWKPEHQYRAMILGQLNWILIVSQLSRSAYDWAIGEPFDYQASPVMASVRDFLFGIGKVRKLVLQGKDPYVDISMDDVIGAVEFFGKAIGQVTGYPTPFLVQVERAQREYIQKAKAEGKDIEATEIGKRLIFSAWALEPPKQSTKEKAQEVSDKLGELIKEVDEVRAEYGLPGEYYGMTTAGSKFRDIFAHTLLSDITEENGFDRLAVAWAEMEIARQSHADLLPNIPLYKINTDPMEGLTIVKLHQLWEARSRLTRLPEIVEFDKTWSDVHVEHGNVTRQQYNLLVKYLEAEDKDAFLENHPNLKINPRNEWLKDQQNARGAALLALGGQAKILSLDAYKEFNRLVKELDIPEDAIPEFTLPPETSIETHFGYEEMVSEGKHGSWEAQLLLLKDAEAAKEAGVQSYADWHDLQLSDSPTEALELKIKHRPLFEQYETLETDEDRAKLKEDNPNWVADLRRIEAYENNGSDFVEAWVARGKEIDEFGASSNEALVWLLDNPDAYDWAIANELLEDRKDELLEREPILRINVDYAKEDDWYNEGIPEKHDAITNRDARDAAIAEEREQYYIDNPKYYRASYERKALGLKSPDYKPFPENLIDTYVGYYTLPKKPDDWEETTKQDRWYKDDWFLQDDTKFHQALVDFGLFKELRDLSKVPTREVFEKWLHYNSLPTGYERDTYRLDNPDLDEWGVLAKIWTITMSEKRRRITITPAERFEEKVEEREKEFKEILEEIEAKK